MSIELSYPKGIEDRSNKAYETNDTVSFVRFDIFERKGARKYDKHAGINLYMPETLSNPTNVSWDTQSLGQGGANLNQFDSLSDVADYASMTLERMKQGMRAQLAGAAAALPGGGGASGQDILANNEQKIINPYIKMLFRGVNFRNFEFVFKFTPHSEDESVKIWEIIQQFRQSALPEEDEGGYKWKYPREVEITYLYQGRPHPWLNRFKRCVITDCHVNYTGAGFYATMRNGFPAETELRLQFSEIEVLTRKDIVTDYETQQKIKPSERSY